MDTAITVGGVVYFVLVAGGVCTAFGIALYILSVFAKGFNR